MIQLAKPHTILTIPLKKKIPKIEKYLLFGFFLRFFSGKISSGLNKEELEWEGNNEKVLPANKHSDGYWVPGITKRTIVSVKTGWILFLFVLYGVWLIIL